jgi:hypothetical protein
VVGSDPLAREEATMQDQLEIQQRRQLEQQGASTGWGGWSVFASVMLLLIGTFQAMAGFAAILDDEIFVATPDYVYAFDVTTWGWIHLFGGIVVFLAGLGILSGKVWARTVGVIVAFLSMVANFAWLPYQPVWSTIMLTIAGFTIYALIVHGRDVTEYR